MKKIFAVALIAIVCLCGAGCGLFTQSGATTVGAAERRESTTVGVDQAVYW
jgi:hypothetical protein